MTIKELSKKIQQWRENKKSPSERIPDEIWKEAVKIARKTSAHAKVANQLGLNANDLRSKMGLPAKRRKKTENITFKEIKLDTPTSRQPIFELTTAQGVTLRVYQ